jgi:hypothetical protein
VNIKRREVSRKEGVKEKKRKEIKENGDSTKRNKKDSETVGGKVRGWRT